MEKKMTFNEKLAILRKNKGLTQDELAKAIGVSRQAVYKWESGASYPEAPKLLEIKALFGISLDDLFDDSFEVAAPEKKRKPREKKDTVTEKLTPPEPAPVEEAEVSAPVEEASPVAEEAPAEKPKAKEEKKIGFFGRLFGRK